MTPQLTRTGRPGSPRLSQTARAVRAGLYGSMPMKRSIASTMGIIAAATTVLGRNALTTVAIANHTMIWRRVLVPTPISETSARHAL